MKKLGSLFLLALITLASEWALAHEAGTPQLGDHELKTLIYQSINVTLLIVGLIYFVRKPVQKYFEQKRDSFLQVALKAQSAKEQAENDRIDIEVRLTKLKNTSEETLSKAKAEAAELKKQLIAEAEALSLRMKAEAQSTVRVEIERAKASLRAQMIAGAAALAEAELGNKMTPELQSQLAGDFISGLSEVRQ
jgi:F-type H+-transporting ATPase subunit b